MSGRNRAAAALALAVATSACGASPPSARDTVDLYFRCLGRDPIRSLAILSPDFQLAHRLRLGAPLAPGASADPLAAAQVAWLNVQKTAAFQQRARRLSTRWIELREDGDAARASLRVSAGGSPGFAQRFSLSRPGPGSQWRIDAVRQSGLDAANLAAAFAANPGELLRRRLERALRPPGEALREVLDHSFELAANGSANVGPPDDAQTFTVGVAGTLARIEVEVQRRDERAGDLVFDVRPTVAGVPVEDDARALARAVLPAAEVPGVPSWIGFDLRSFEIPVESGDVLAVVLRDPTGDGSSGTYLWSGLFDRRGQGFYAGGQRFIRRGRKAWSGQAGVDLHLRSFVSAVAFAPPEPGASP